MFIARTPIGLIGIVTAPFLHASWEHFFSNVPFVIMFSLGILLREPLVDFVLIWGFAQLLSGLGVWVTGPATPALVDGKMVVIVTVGASGVVMGLFGGIVIRFV